VRNTVSIPTVDDVQKSVAACTLPTRMSVDELLRKICDQIKSAQVAYSNSLNVAVELYTKNVYHCHKMDNVLGPIIERPPPQRETRRQKDGSVSVICRVSGCNTQTFRMKRHIETAHPELQTHSPYLTEIFRIIQKNKSANEMDNGQEASEPEEIQSEMPKRGTISAKQEKFRECSDCGTIVKNMTQHLVKKHRLNMTDDIYR